MIKNGGDLRDHRFNQEDPLKEDMATHSSVLTWRIPWTEEPGGLQSIRVSKNWTQLKGFRIFANTVLNVKVFFLYLRHFTIFSCV